MSDDTLAAFMSGSSSIDTDQGHDEAGSLGSQQDFGTAGAAGADGTAGATGAGGPSQPLWADSFVVDPKGTLPEYDTTFADAYAGVHEGASSGETVVLVGNSKMPIRVDVAASLRSCDQSCMMPMLDIGAVHHPKTGLPAPAICYLRPKGNHLVELTEIPFPPLREDSIIQDVISPVARALEEFAKRRIFHGRINPANMIRREGAQGEVVVGDCLMGPPGYDQPLAFETIERALAR